MNRAEVLQVVEPQLTPKRYAHTLRVTETAIELAHLYQALEEKVELAALFHDYAKNYSLEDLKERILTSDLPNELLDYHSELWHGPVASLIMKNEYDIKDTDVLNAVYYHTTGQANMGKIEMIIFVADYIEPGRDFPGLDEVREVAQQDLIQAAWLALKNSIQFLMNKKSVIHPDSFAAYNDLTQKLTGGN